jgi:hypothetical protein
MLPHLLSFQQYATRLFYLQDADLRAFIEPLPRQSDNDGLQLLVRERHATIMSHAGADEAAFVEFSRAQPQAKAIMYQNLHAVRAFVDEEVGVMRTRFAKDIHNPGQRLVDAGTHVDRLYRKPGRIDPDHLMSSRNSNAHSCPADAGHSTLTVPPRRFTSIRITPSAGLAGSDIGRKLSLLSIPALGTVVRIAIGFLLRSAAFTQRCNMAALRPRAKATAAIDTPGCWHAPTASALKCALWVRRRRRPVTTS